MKFSMLLWEFAQVISSQAKLFHSFHLSSPLCKASMRAALELTSQFEWIRYFDLVLLVGATYVVVVAGSNVNPFVWLMSSDE